MLGNTTRSNECRTSHSELGYCLGIARGLDPGILRMIGSRIDHGSVSLAIHGYPGMHGPESLRHIERGRSVVKTVRGVVLYMQGVRPL